MPVLLLIFGKRNNDCQGACTGAGTGTNMSSTGHFRYRIYRLLLPDPVRYGSMWNKRRTYVMSEKNSGSILMIQLMVHPLFLSSNSNLCYCNCIDWGRTSIQPIWYAHEAQLSSSWRSFIPILPVNFHNSVAGDSPDACSLLSYTVIFTQ
jgi:hypothetical protein